MATFTVSGTASRLVSASLPWKFLLTAVPFQVFLTDHPSTYPTAGLRWGTATQVPREPGQPRPGVEGVGLFGDEALEFDEEAKNGNRAAAASRRRHPPRGLFGVGVLATVPTAEGVPLAVTALRAGRQVLGGLHA